MPFRYVCGDSLKLWDSDSDSLHVNRGRRICHLKCVRDFFPETLLANSPDKHQFRVPYFAYNNPRQKRKMYLHMTAFVRHPKQHSCVSCPALYLIWDRIESPHFSACFRVLRSALYDVHIFIGRLKMHLPCGARRVFMQNFMLLVLHAVGVQPNAPLHTLRACMLCMFAYLKYIFFDVQR